MTISGPIWNKKIYDWEFFKKMIKDFDKVKKNKRKYKEQKNQIFLQTKLKMESSFYAIFKEVVFSDIIFAFHPNDYVHFFHLDKKPKIDLLM